MKSKPASPSPAYSPTEDFERRYVRPHRGRALIVGSQVYEGRGDRRKRYADAVGVDMLDGPGVDVVANLEETPPAELGLFAHIECMSVLEHSRRPWLLAATLEGLLIRGGTLFVAVPFMWRYHAYDHDYYRFSPDGIRALFEGIEWKAIMYSHRVLTAEGEKIPAEKIDGFPHYPRTEVLAFGMKWL